MTEHRSVLLHTRIYPGHKTYVIIRHCVGRTVEHDTVRRKEILIDSVHGFCSLILWRRAGEHCPGIGFQMYPSLFVLLCSDLPAVFGDAADIPFTVPKLTVADLLHMLCHCRVFLYILFFTQIGGCLKETPDGPVVQEGYHGALTTA